MWQTFDLFYSSPVWLDLFSQMVLLVCRMDKFIMDFDKFSFFFSSNHHHLTVTDHYFCVCILLSIQFDVVKRSICKLWAEYCVVLNCKMFIMRATNFIAVNVEAQKIEKDNKT